MNLESVRGWMRGEDCLMVAPGPSAHAVDVSRYRDHWTICCNRAVVFGSPDVAMCLEPFKDPCWDVIRAAEPFIVFSHICEDRRGMQTHPRIIQIGSRDVLPWLVPDAETQEPLKVSMSSFYGCAVATLLGFETIGLIGVDITADRWREWEISRFNERWDRLHGIAQDLGSRMVNLSDRSSLTSIPAGSWDVIREKKHKDISNRKRWPSRESLRN